ncbi:MAG: hypothetical protein P8K13_02810 [Synechococcus sp. cluster2_bin.209]|nr:hypothetical protein [Synechococcus sp. cluster2_bin.209]
MPDSIENRQRLAPFAMGRLKRSADPHVIGFCQTNVVGIGGSAR